MFKFLKDRKKDNKGFTLVELVIVVAILAILVGILAPQYTKYVEKSRKSADAANMDEMVRAVEIYAADGENTPISGSAVITIGNSSTSVAASAAQSSISGGQGIVVQADDSATKKDTTVEMVKNALSTHVKDYEQISMKSRDWGDDGKGITATVTVTADGSVTVAYGPEKFKKYMGQKTN